MTSQSPKSLRTTAPRTSRAGTGISLVAVLTVAGFAPAQYVPITPATQPPPASPFAPVLPAVADLPGTLAPAPEAAGRPVPGRPVKLQKADDEYPLKQKVPDPNQLDPKEVRQIYEQRYGKLPGKLEVFRFESQGELERRILHELHRDDDAKELADNKFPSPPKLAADGTPFVSKTASYPPVRALVEPGYVVHRRLYFEDKNSERYGWDLGIIQPVVSGLEFFKDVLVMPAKIASNPHERYDTSAGKCLPGSPVPYYLYPPEVDIWGATFAAGIYTGTAFLFP